MDSHYVEFDMQQDGRIAKDFVQNLLSPGFSVLWASDDSQQRFARWQEEHGTRCVQCGRTAILNIDGNEVSIPAWWWGHMPDMPVTPPLCDECKPAAAQLPPWSPPAPPV